MMRWLLMLALIGIAAPASAETVYERCMDTGTCRAQIERDIAAAVDAYKATLPCQVFVYADEAASLVGLTERACIIVETVTPCGDDYCSTWPTRP